VTAAQLSEWARAIEEWAARLSMEASELSVQAQKMREALSPLELPAPTLPTSTGKGEP